MKKVFKKIISSMLLIICGTFLFACEQKEDHVHEYSKTVTNPTCTEKGHTHYKCECGDEYDDNYVDALGHSYGEWKSIKDATCLEKGKEERTCSRCDKKEERDVDALGHSYDEKVVEPTCFEKGYTIHECQNCDDSYIDTYVETIEHSYGKWEISVEPTKQDGGKLVRNCQNEGCDAYEEYELYRFNVGTYWHEVVTPATCTEKGVDSYKITVDEQVFIFEVETDILEHNYSEEYIKTKDTHYYECSGCGDKKEEAPHIYEDLVCKDCGYLESLNYLELKDNEDGTTTVLSCDKEAITVILPDSVRIISDEAFKDCTKLKSITIPEGVEKIGANAFQNCVALEEVNYNAKNVEEFTLDTRAFVRAGMESGGFVLNVGANVQKIPDYMFYGTSDMGEDYSNLINIKYADGCVCEVIGSYAFGGCINLIEITIPENIKILEDFSFSSTKNVEKINYLAKNIADEDIGNAVLNNSGFLTEGIDIIIGKNVTRIPANLFGLSNNQSGVIRKYKSLSFEENSSCIEIGNYAFSYTELQEVELPNTALSIGENAFLYCENIKEITIPENVEFVDLAAFKYCTGLEVINFNASNARGCDSMFSFAGNPDAEVIVNIGKEVQKLGERMFHRSNVSIFNIDRDCKLEEIEAYTFSTEGRIKEIVIPENVKTIHEFAFAENVALEKIYFYAKECDDLNYDSCIFPTLSASESNIELIIGKDVKNIPAYMFYSSRNNSKRICVVKKVTIEENSVLETIGAYAFKEAGLFTDFVFVPTIKSIGDYAFEGADIESVNLSDNIESIGIRAFYECSFIESISIGKNLKTLGDRAFEGCGKVKEIYYNAIDAEIAVLKVAFGSRCGNLAEGIKLTIGKDVLVVPNSMFYTTEQITTIEFEEGCACTIIETNAFRELKNLVDIVLPETITTIEKNAFFLNDSTNNSLQYIYFRGTKNQWTSIDVGTNNTMISDEKVYFYAEKKPVIIGQYWYYNDEGIKEIWEYE